MITTGPTKRSASAVWHGDLKKGQAALATRSGVLQDTPWPFVTRFEGEPGSSAEELFAAGSYSRRPPSPDGAAVACP